VGTRPSSWQLSHIATLLCGDYRQGLDFDTAIAQGRYIALDAADVLSTFMLNGMPDPIRFMEAFRNLVQRASKAKGEQHSRIPIFGECVRILVEQGNAEAAIQMEELGNQLTALYNVEILCGYCLASKAGAMDSQIFRRICEQHSAAHSC
jgi:hypothetical protein